MELAFLRDKVRKPDGTLMPWRSPEGKPMRIAAAYPRWPWSDLVDALLPNGRFLDTQVAPRFKQSLNPVGIPIQSYISGLFAARLRHRLLLRRPPRPPRPAPTATPTSPRTSPASRRDSPCPRDAQAALRAASTDHNGAYALRFLDGALERRRRC